VPVRARRNEMNSELASRSAAGVRHARATSTVHTTRCRTGRRSPGTLTRFMPSRTPTRGCQPAIDPMILLERTLEHVSHPLCELAPWERAVN